MQSPDRRTDQAERLAAAARRHVRSIDLTALGGAVLRTDSRAGREEGLARLLVPWGLASTGASGAQWAVQDVAPGRANLVSWMGTPTWEANRGLWFYGHLDTSLTGDPVHDLPLTGWGRPSGPAVADEDGLTGLGVAVSKGPAICALVAYTALARAAAEMSHPLEGGLLLAAGGTHRAPSGGFGAVRDDGLDSGLGLGVEAALSAGLRPAAVINVKGGASGVLSAEPGCLLLRVEIRTAAVALPNRSEPPGAAVLAAAVTQEVEAWRADYVAGSRDPAEQVAVDACVGAVEAGLSYKPDFLPGSANVYVYVVTLPGCDTRALTGELRGRLERRLATRTSAAQVHVVTYGEHAGQATAESSPVVLAARAAFERRSGPGSSRVRGYRGSTDGVIFRRAGIDTVRFGPTAVAVQGDPSVEHLSAAELTRFIDLYVDTAARYFADEQPASREQRGQNDRSLA